MQQLATQILRVVNRVSDSMAWLCGLLFLLLAVFMSIDVTSRFLGGPFSGIADHIASIVLALGGTWSMSRALSDGSHVRIDIFKQLYNVRVNGLFYLLAMGLMTLVASVLAYQAWAMTAVSWVRQAEIPQSMISLPLALPQMLTALGFTMLTLQAVAMFIAGVALVLGGTFTLARTLESRAVNGEEVGR